ncbi:MAG: hypothetical protein GXO47_14550 [Chlorobi bacterium]|nr:hypothetical protein [Chlorobiota bacterium]
MPKGLKYLIIFTIILSVPVVSIAQFSKQKPRRPKKYRAHSIWDGFSVSPMVGINMFYGDLVDNSRTSYSGGAIAEREISPYLSARLQLMAGKMKGAQYTNNDLLSADFTNMYVDFAMGVKFKPLDVIYGYFKERPFNPYIFGQVGIIYYNATEKFYEGYPVPYRPDREASGMSPIVSFGPGLSYWVSPRISVRAELNGVYVFGDEVDAHKEWENQEGDIFDTNSNDYYYTITAGVTYLINDAKWKNMPKYSRKAYLKTREKYNRAIKAAHKRRSKKHSYKRK